MTDQPHAQDTARPVESRSSAGRLAKARPVATFLVLTFGWTWLFWCAAIPFRAQPLLVTSLVLIGGFGPALAAVESLRLRSGLGLDLSVKRVTAMWISAAVIFGVISLRYSVGNAPGVREIAPDLTLTTPAVLAAAVACLVGGWVISAAVSDNRQVRDRIASILPSRLPLGWTVLALVVLVLERHFFRRRFGRFLRGLRDEPAQFLHRAVVQQQRIDQRRSQTPSLGEARPDRRVAGGEDALLLRDDAVLRKGRRSLGQRRAQREGEHAHVLQQAGEVGQVLIFKSKPFQELHHRRQSTGERESAAERIAPEVQVKDRLLVAAAQLPAAP
jgi:hypothetical protein